MSFQLESISENVFCIEEEDEMNLKPLMYLIVGSEDKALLIDTGCGCGNLYFYLKTIEFLKDMKLIVVNTHNHPEQTGGNWRFSTTGQDGRAHNVVDLCASNGHKYYTRLMNSNWHWQVETYKITRWLSDGETILLGDENDPINVIKIIHVPGHTPDSLVLWYEYNARMFVGDLLYRFDDIPFLSDYADMRDYERSVRKILDFVINYEITISYSAAKNDINNCIMPVLKHHHRFLLSILAGSNQGVQLRIDDAEGFRFETRDKAIRIVISRKIVNRLNKARDRASNQVGSS